MREEIARTEGDVFWSDLQAHAARDALIIVSPEVDLVDAAVAIANNDVQQVDGWIRSGLLSKPTEEDLERWPLDANQRFTMVIIRPFVLIRRPKAKVLS